ncbi:uncharacterized protein C14orf93 homolog [Melanotaenia boesemani]|uniref:uncharacterized protein C14orf93 homolog n=1 Tax=Melanotaenia boesemani TaxID=1250792 RepID=UPI001C04AEF0|nr:uncharacterized protein C14orf93 homolog [Melanotaenia boesemani]XP_041824391.1 uncharacterized protein C14orf93 homolog [Melanotaenia boesemani]XP_041846200.1 uncharacterized protein C14orf93 homolog [Melanotaenia boesemani]XP_041856512.1 uncharacterized protein C14orf93 homolog [Melanotaenia boesemani]XP_041859783.1 uncharacterized protein C14orf93 homolog [Melanotaenia boesemani]
MSKRRRVRLQESDSEDEMEMVRSFNETPRSRTREEDRHRRLISPTPGGSRGASQSYANTSTGITLDDIWTFMCTSHNAVMSLAAKVDEMNKNLDSLKEMVTKAQTDMHSENIKAKIPKALSREVKRLHSGLGEEMHFKGNEKFSSDHNMAVTATITQAIRDQQEFEPEEIHRACSRYYEHCKRDHKLVEENKIKEDRRGKALNNRRHRLLNQRKEVARNLLSKDDLTYLEGAVAALMSDEETDTEDTMAWKVSSPSWRADKLTRILHQCQNAIEEKYGHSRMAHRRTTSGVASQRQAPKGINPIYMK